MVLHVTKSETLATRAKCAIIREIMASQQFAEELRKPIIRKILKTKGILNFIKLPNGEPIAFKL